MSGKTLNEVLADMGCTTEPADFPYQKRVLKDGEVVCVGGADRVWRWVYEVETKDTRNTRWLAFCHATGESRETPTDSSPLRFMIWASKQKAGFAKAHPKFIHGDFVARSDEAQAAWTDWLWECACAEAVR